MSISESVAIIKQIFETVLKVLEIVIKVSTAVVEVLKGTK